MMLFWCFLVLIATIWLYFKSKYSYWKTRGIITPPYKYLFGNLGDAVIIKRSTGAIHTDIYNEYKGHNYVGFYKFMQPGLVIRNPDIVRDILSKNFNNFQDNDFHLDEKVDVIFGKNPFSLRGERWKTVRAQMTPCFSTSKMKQIVPFIQANARKMVEFLKEKGDCIEAKELSNLYTAENTANCAFGVEGNNFANPNSEFRMHGDAMLKPTTLTALKNLVIFIMPELSRLFKVKLVTDGTTRFFRNLVKQTIGFRTENNIQSNDFIDFMIKTKEKINNDELFGLDDIVAHAGGFFLDGYETSSVAISYTLYEIAAHVDVQEKLRSEIKNILMKYNGELTYDAIQEMDYLDCVFKENLRKNVPLMAMSKVCTEKFTLPPKMEDNTGPELTVEPGTVIIIPVYGFHNDAKYFSDPDRFYPERFSGENKNNLKGLYLPFGDGPRMCLGSKFGVLQSKMAIAAAVANFEIRVDKKTKEPLQLDHRHFMLAPLGGLWLNFKKIES